MSFYGTLLDVQTINIGTSLSVDAPTGTTVLTVDDATMFDEDGGLLTIADTVYTYLTADLDAGLITLDAAGLLTDATAGDQVETYPTAQQKLALVDLGIHDGDFEGVWATVPQALVAGLPDGLRDPAAAETVLVEEPTPGELVLADATAAAANIPTDTIMDPSSDEPTQPQTVMTKVQSADYAPGDTGWALNDETVQLPDVNVIGELGADALTANTITLGDDDLANDLINPLSIGSVSYDVNTSGSHTGNFGTSEKLLFRYATGPLRTGRMYRIVCFGHLDTQVASSVDIRWRYTWDGTTPGLSSTSLRVQRVVTVAAGTSTGFYMERIYQPGADYDNVRIAITGQVISPNSGLAYIGGIDSNRAFTMYVEDLGTSIAAGTAGALSQKSFGTGTYPAPPPDPTSAPDPSGTVDTGVTQPDPVTTYTKTWWATWARSYDSDGGTRNGDDTTDLYQGYISGTHGNTRSLFGFDYADIQAKLAGANVVKITITYRVKYAWGGAGIRVVLSSHTYGSKPGTWAGGNVNNDVADWGSQKAGVTYTHDLTGLGISDGFRTGTVKGLGFGPGKTNDPKIYFARMYGAGSSRPRITIVYRR